MIKRNPNLNALKTNYLFPEINSRKQQFLAEHPDAKLISLGIGDTTEPLPSCISKRLAEAASRLGTREGYSGYGPEQGLKDLREKIASTLYHGKVSPDDVFISDGAKCDIGRLQALFGSEVSVAVQDPSYPVYIDGSLIQGVKSIFPLPCTPENNFFPDFKSAPPTDLIYMCSPNNPTGAAATKEQLEQLVAFAKRNGSIIIYDSAYAHYIQDPSLPRSIYEIAGADETAIEVGSFSKIAGFTGVRLGWCIVPAQLKYSDGQSVKTDWKRVSSTIFNGASNIAQWGGCAVLDEEGLNEIKAMSAFYMENTKIIKKALTPMGCKIYGGENAPYIWAHFQETKSWDTFQFFLEKMHLITTPGIGFGPHGEGFIRLAAFGHRDTILQAAERLA